MEKTRRGNANQKALKLAGRNRLVITKTGAAHTLQLVTSDGATPICIEVTSRGIALRIDGPEVALHAAGRLSLSAQKLVLKGSRGIEIASGGDLKIAATGELRSDAGGHVVRAVRGSVDVKASDDVKLSGERVMVNCDETVDRYYREPAALAPREANALAAKTPQTGSNKPG
jgi:hypothetical protein